MHDVALMTYGVLRAEVEESLHAVGYFDQAGDRDERQYIYKSPLMNEMYDESSLLKILEDAFFDSFSAVSYERLHTSDLHATTRVYDEHIDTVIPLGEHKGVVFTLARDGEYYYREILNSIEDAVADERLGVDISE